MDKRGLARENIKIENRELRVENRRLEMEVRKLESEEDPFTVSYIPRNKPIDTNVTQEWKNYVHRRD